MVLNSIARRMVHVVHEKNIVQSSHIQKRLLGEMKTSRFRCGMQSSVEVCDRGALVRLSIGRYGDNRCRQEESREAADVDNAGVVDVWDHVSLVGKSVGT